MRKLTTILILLGLLLGTIPYVWAANIVTIKQLGREVAVSLNPQRVVILDYSALDTMRELGVADNIIALAKATLPQYLAEYGVNKYQDIGNLKDFDFEKIKRLKPDLILISARQEPMYDELRKIAPTVSTGIISDRYMESFRENTRLLSSLWGKEAEAEALITALEGEIGALRNELKTLEGKGLIVLYNAGKFSAYGSGSRFGIIHDEFGIKPVNEGIQISNHGQSITSEYIMQANPDYLFVVDRNVVVSGKLSNTKEIENRLVQKTKAYKNGKIIYLAPDHWYLSNGGAGSIRLMLKDIMEGIIDK